MSDRDKSQRQSVTRVRARWALLFFALILLPVSLLTYQSIQSIQDEKQSVMDEQQLMASLLQEMVARLLDEVAQNIAYADASDIDLGIYDSFAEVKHAFALGRNGYLEYPFSPPLQLGERRDAFAKALVRAEKLEFVDADYPKALEAHWSAWKEAQSDEENAEALNALGRCALRVNDLKTAADIHRKLTFYNRSFDADGAHPATLSHLRLARRLGAERGAEILAEWVQLMLDGHYPLYAGSRQAVVEAREIATAWSGGDRGKYKKIWEGLSRLERRIEFSRHFTAELQSALGSEDGYISGARDEGDFLLYSRRLADGATLGLLFDIDEVRATLARSSTSMRFRERGFSFDLFSLARERDFRAKRADTIHLVAPLGHLAGDMQLGIYALDPGSAVDFYRQRNLALLVGLFALAGFVALGSYAIFRDTDRQMQMAHLRSEFVANVSHELRTPLTAIRMNAETLLTRRYDSEEKRDELLRRVLREGERLGLLVDNILTFSRIESGRATYDRSPVDLGEITSAALELFAAPLQQRSFALDVQIEGDLPPLRADREALFTAVTNLLSNAMKYSQEKKEIAVAVRHSSAELVVEVADRGIGIPEAERGRIFDKFYRASNTTQHAAAGTGVGLALVHSIVSAHGGRAETAAREGGGTVFRLIFPIAPAS